LQKQLVEQESIIKSNKSYANTEKISTMSAQDKNGRGVALTPPIAHGTIFGIEHLLQHNENDTEAGTLTPPVAVGTYFVPSPPQGTLVGSKDATPFIQNAEAVFRRPSTEEELLHVPELQSSIQSGKLSASSAAMTDREALANLIASNDGAFPRTRTRSDILGYLHAAIAGLLDILPSTDDEDRFQSLERKVEAVHDFVARIDGSAKEQTSGSVATRPSPLVSDSIMRIPTLNFELVETSLVAQDSTRLATQSLESDHSLHVTESITQFPSHSRKLTPLSPVS
jgi:hypothetical protein